MFISITSPLDNSIYDITWIRLETWPDDNRLCSDGIKRWPVYIFLLLIIYYCCLLYAYYMISLLQHHVLYIYYYRVCITIVYITASFILPLTRSLSNDPEFACPGWRSELPYYQIEPWSHIGDSSSRLFIGIFVLCSYYLIYPCFYICYDR